MAADRGRMSEVVMNRSEAIGADAAVDVAECGTASWRESKLAWLQAFAAFRSVELGSVDSIPAGGAPIDPRA